MIGILSMDPNSAITTVEKIATSNSILKWYTHCIFYFSKMFISLENFLIFNYSDKFLYGHLRPVWSSLKYFLILIFAPQYS